MAHRKWTETLFPVRRLEHSQSKYTYPTHPTVHYISVPHTRGATTSRSKDIVTFWSKKCIFAYLTGQKGGISPHTGKPEKSRLLRFLIISKYFAPQKVWKKSYGSFSRTRPYFGFWTWSIKAWQGGRSGPLPAPKKPKIPQKRRPPRSRESVAIGFWRYFRRKAGGPARLRSASVVQSCFIFGGFSICFPILIRV